jgi:hypothetical protein
VTLFWLYYLFTCFGGQFVYPWLLDSCQQASETLLDGVMYFLLGISAGGFSLIFNYNYSTYNQYIVSIVIAITFLNLLVLVWITRQQVLNKKVIPLCFCLTVSFTMVLLPSIMALVNDKIWVPMDTPCLQEQLDTQGRVFGNFYKWISALMFIILLIFAITLTAILPSTEVGLVRGKFLKLLITFITATPILIIWLCVYLFFNLRAAMCTIAEDTWTEAEFGFGQAVALVTWVPAVIAFLCGLFQHRSHLGEGNKDRICLTLW